MSVFENHTCYKKANDIWTLTILWIIVYVNSVLGTTQWGVCRESLGNKHTRARTETRRLTVKKKIINVINNFGKKKNERVKYAKWNSSKKKKKNTVCTSTEFRNNDGLILIWPALIRRKIANDNIILYYPPNALVVNGQVCRAKHQTVQRRRLRPFLRREFPLTLSVFRLRLRSLSNNMLSAYQ